jgi:hypothetical protein
MSLKLAVSAFAKRGVRRRQAFELILYSGGLVIALLLLAWWIVMRARENGPIPDCCGESWPQVPWSVLGLADAFAVGLLALGLFVIAPAAVAVAVAGERRAGTLDQLRTTPVDPLGLLAGFVLGAPSRFYLLCAGPLALHILCGLTGVIPAEVLVSSTITLAAGGLLCALLAVTLSLAPQHDGGGPFVALAVAGLIAASGLIAMVIATERDGSRWAFVHPAGALQATMLSYDGLWRHLMVSRYALEKFADPRMAANLWLSPLLSVLFSVSGSILLARAACRRLASPDKPLLGKGLALLMFTVAAASVILPFDRSHYGGRSMVTYAPLAFGLVLLPVMSLLSLAATPSFRGWAIGLRAGARTHAFSDSAGPFALVASMLGVFIALCLISLVPAGFPDGVRDRHLAAFVWAAWTALTVAPFAKFASTRFTTTATRTAFIVAVLAHLLFQVICGGLMTDHYKGSTELMVLELGGLLALAVPAWVVWRQSVLRKRTLAPV